MSDIAVRDKDYAEVLAYEKKLVDSIDELTRTIDISEQSFEAQTVEALAMKAVGLIFEDPFVAQTAADNITKNREQDEMVGGHAGAEVQLQDDLAAGLHPHGKHEEQVVGGEEVVDEQLQEHNLAADPNLPTAQEIEEWTRWW